MSPTRISKQVRVSLTMFDQIKDFINPSKNPDLTPAHEYQRKHLPTLWLLGKTGAGKSSFIQAVTGDSSVEVGNGFAPVLHSYVLGMSVSHWINDGLMVTKMLCTF